MEQTSEAGKINISGAVYELVKSKFACTSRGEIEAKNRGRISMYFVDSRS
jgi:class 3 adenylate cyclase